MDNTRPGKAGLTNILIFTRKTEMVVVVDGGGGDDGGDGVGGYYVTTVFCLTVPPVPLARV